ncbi:MAG TPA: aromatic ring-hydroxylating dioxygenase subunit alpha [Acidimicrobiales bacterium]|nr:aromatic ring-hydroxylating dioxygenase subunit alpha [Acidimicrobiales bacterium]
MRHDEQVRLVKELIARLDSGTNVDAGGLRKNPVEVYSDPEIAAREWHEFFETRPQLIGLSADLPEPGSFLTTDDLGFPLLATRAADGTFHAMVNSCRHRGAVLETGDRGSARRFTCQFHAWTYDGEGTLVGLPKQDHFGEIDTSCSGLIKLPALEWNGLLYVHPDPSGTIDLEGLFGDELSAELAHWNFGELSYLDRDSYDVACNWKLAMDTFGETYHFSSLHKDSLYNVFHGNVQCYDTFGINHRMILTRREIDQMRHEPEERWDITRAGLPVYWLFPNVVLMPFQEGVYLVRTYPVPGEPGRHTSRITFYLRPGVSVDDSYGTSDTGEAEFAEEFRAKFEGVEAQRMVAELFAAIIRDEDYVMSASQQVTAESGQITHALFGRNEPALHHYHSTYRSLLGLDPLPLLEDADV